MLAEIKIHYSRQSYIQNLHKTNKIEVTMLARELFLT